MRPRFLTAAVVFAACSLTMVGQTSPAKSTYTPPKTPWGEPDLQGNWPAQFNIPRERPTNVKDTVLSDDEVAQRQARTSKQFQANVQANRATVTTAPPAGWGEIGQPNKQTSLLVDPPDAIMPP